jgi:hypothetical protein
MAVFPVGFLGMLIALVFVASLLPFVAVFAILMIAAVLISDHNRAKRKRAWLAEHPEDAW